MNLAQAKMVVGERSPEFESPPVVETALGVRFLQVEGMNLSLQAGQLLRKYAGEFGKLEIKPPIGTELQICIGQPAGTLSLPIRCWLVNTDGSQLIQVQDDLFIRNWRATGEKAEYQHYSSISPLFKRDWQLFNSFLGEERLKRPSIWQCEVTYVNHLIRGREWKDLQDISRLFPVWRGVDLKAIFTTVETAAFSVSLKLPDENGRIQFALQPGVRRDGQEILQLTVTALGKPADDTDEAVYEWLDYGHLAVVNGFVQFTSEEAHKIWRKK